MIIKIAVILKSRFAIMLSEMGYTTKLLKTFNLIKNWCEKIKGNRQSDEKRLLCRLRVFLMLCFFKVL